MPSYFKKDEKAEPELVHATKRREEVVVDRTDTATKTATKKGEK